MLAAVNGPHLPGTDRGGEVRGLWGLLEAKLKGDEETRGAGGQPRAEAARARRFAVLSRLEVLILDTRLLLGPRGRSAWPALPTACAAHAGSRRELRAPARDPHPPLGRPGSSEVKTLPLCPAARLALASSRVLQVRVPSSNYSQEIPSGGIVSIFCTN